MANFLAGLTNLTQAASAGISGASSSGSIATGVSAALSALGGLGVSGGGSKPKALHTEYASGEANWQKPYGSGTDIVFYLVRADGGPQNKTDAEQFAPNGSLPFEVSPGLGVAENIGPTGEGFFSSAAQTGAGFPTNVQSPLNQIAARSTFGGLSALTVWSEPRSWLDHSQDSARHQSVKLLGNFSQTFAQLSSTASKRSEFDSICSARLSH